MPYSGLPARHAVVSHHGRYQPEKSCDALSVCRYLCSLRSALEFVMPPQYHTFAKFEAGKDMLQRRQPDQRSCYIAVCEQSLSL